MVACCNRPQAIGALPLDSVAFRNCLELAVQMSRPEAHGVALLEDALEAGLVKVRARAPALPSPRPAMRMRHTHEGHRQRTN